MESIDSMNIFMEEPDLQPKLIDILANAINMLEGNGGIIALRSKGKRLFIQEAVYGLDSCEVDQLQPLLEGAIPKMARSRQSFGRLSRLVRDTHGLSATILRLYDPIIVLPFQVDNRTTGLIFVLRSYSDKPFEESHRRLLSPFAAQVALLIRNTFLARELTEERYKINTILENSASGIMTIDPRCRIISFNAAMEKLTGWKNDEVVGRFCYDVVKAVDSKGVAICKTKCPLVKVADSFFKVEGVITSKDRQKVDVSMHYYIVRSAGGKPLSAVVSTQDISRLVRTENLRSMLLATVSHELQTPISIIKAYASTLNRPDANWDEQTIRDKLNAIDEESDRLNELVSKLLYTSRLDTGNFSLNTLLLDLPMEVQKVAKRFTGHTETHEIKNDFPPDFPPVLADPEKIEEVLINLVQNSIKFSPEGGKITIKGEISDNQVLVSITDDGVGIPLRDHEYVFERFYRVEDGSSRPTKGIGLGLYICKTLIEAHGGQIWVDGTVVRGTRITFSLPLQGNNKGNLL